MAKFNKDNPFISVAMATFNGEKYLLNQLESISNQTLLPDELIITDDSSTDSTLDIIKLLEKLNFNLYAIRDDHDNVGKYNKIELINTYKYKKYTPTAILDHIKQYCTN